MRSQRSGRPGIIGMVVETIRRYLPLAVLVAAAVVALSFVPSLGSRVGKAPVTLSDATGLPPGVGPAPNPGTPGLTVGGVSCGPAVRQVPWSKYAPICVPAWHGNNGGATAPGVTGTTITVTYREVASAELATLYSIVPKSVVGTDQGAIKAIQAYISLFNRTFELYGRHVVLKPFASQSDFVAELDGGDQAQAQADAETAKADHAFADLSVIDATPVYDQALAEQHIISFTPFGGPDSEFAQFSPYEYSTIPVCQKTNLGTAEVIGRSLARTPVSFSGDPSMNGKHRVFGIVYDSDPTDQECNNALEKDLASYGVKVATTAAVSLNGSTLQEQIANVVAQFKAAHVTTVIATGLDWFTPILLTAAANQQGYYPEWFTTDFIDGFSRLVQQNQWSHAIALGMQAQAEDQSEAYKAYRMSGATGPLIPTYPFVYQPVLMLFDAIQQAGPYLTPRTFQQGFRSLPPSLPGGMYGQWAPGPGSYDPFGSFSVVWWSPKAVSAVDGPGGAWLSCNGGAQYSYSPGGAKLPYGKPLGCFGRSGPG
ncbi:MAG: ABC transporter substrate-binding protein [Acidimicrobiales bacterium]